MPKTSGLGASNTITLPVGSSEISSFVSVFVLFIFVKDFWILFRHTNSACYFYHDTITRRVALLESDPVPGSQPDICLHHVKINTYISIPISIYSIYLSIYLYIYRQIYLSIYIFIYITWSYEWSIILQKNKKADKRFPDPFYWLVSNTSRLQSDYGDTIYTFEH